MSLYIIYCFIILIIILLVLKRFTLWPFHKNVWVLMYHHIKPKSDNDIVVTIEQFEKQIQLIIEKGYHFISCNELIQYIYNDKDLPSNPILLTFDDAYIDFEIYALPILTKYQAKAIVFVPSKYIGGENEWDKNGEKIMSVESLKKLPVNIEIGLHSHAHLNFKTKNINEIKNDLQLSIETLVNHQIPYIKALAYPYGAYPKTSKLKKQIEELLIENKIQISFRIGNRINNLFMFNPFFIQRIDVKGQFNLKQFASKLRYSKL